MQTEELAVNDNVEVTYGLFKGTKGFVEAIDPESSVVVIRDWSGGAAYAFKNDVKRT